MAVGSHANARSAVRTQRYVLPSDLFFPESVASVSGFNGSGAAIGTTVFELAGHISDARLAMGTHLFDPLMILAGLIPFVGMILVLLLVRNTKATKDWYTKSELRFHQAMSPGQNAPENQRDKYGIKP